MDAANQPNVPPTRTIDLAINYVGTPVTFITTVNETGAVNLTPTSSSWSLSNRFVLGLASAGKGIANMRNSPDCVLNFPSSAMWESVERIARFTGRDPVPDHKAKMGYQFEPRKEQVGGFTYVPSELVAPPRIAECPLQFECRTVEIIDLEGNFAGGRPETLVVAHVEVLRVHAHESILAPDMNKIDTGAWSPLLYVFRDYFGTGSLLGSTFRK
jgi:flavin reductase (DIM6/NTAB) family NADH-FMN oxidoreductase RutF